MSIPVELERNGMDLGIYRGKTDFNDGKEVKSCDGGVISAL